MLAESIYVLVQDILSFKLIRIGIRSTVYSKMHDKMTIPFFIGTGK